MCVKHTARSTLQNSKEEPSECIYEPVGMQLMQKSLKIYILNIEFVGRLDE